MGLALPAEDKRPSLGVVSAGSHPIVATGGVVERFRALLAPCCQVLPPGPIATISGQFRLFVLVHVPYAQLRCSLAVG